ncbi:MATE family efflux transporter, partial [bacterium]|nr:MATE family efflux transporter [bacterium]
QFLLFFSYFIDGFAYAAEAIIGKFFGAKNKLMLVKATKILFIWGAAFGLLFTLIYALGGKYILSFFTDKLNVIEEAQNYLIWLVFIPLVSFASYIWDGIYIGATASKAMRNTMIISSVIFFFVPYYLLADIMGPHAIWLAMLLYMLSRSLSQTIIAPWAVFKKLK